MKPLVCLVSDVRGWAFDQNMHDLAEYLSDEFNFEHFYVVEWLKNQHADWGKFDLIFEVFHRNPPMGIMYDRAVGALRSQWFRPEKPEPPTATDVAIVNKYQAFSVATRRNFEDLHGRCPSVVYLTNPVNMKRFKESPLVEGEIVAEWNGNSDHTSPDGRKIKHFHDIVVPACRAANVKLVAAEYGTSEGPYRKRSFAEMPEFYRQANVALCASEYEAASFSVMEAMASGLAVVATDVGNHREMRDSQLAAFGESGMLLVDRSVDAFVQALKTLTPKRAARMGEINKAEIAARWSWEAWSERYRKFFRKGLSK